MGITSLGLDLSCGWPPQLFVMARLWTCRWRIILWKYNFWGPLSMTLELQQCTKIWTCFIVKSCTHSLVVPFCKDSLHDLTMQAAKRVKLYIYNNHHKKKKKPIKDRYGWNHHMGDKKGRPKDAQPKGTKGKKKGGKELVPLSWYILRTKSK